MVANQEETPYADYVRTLHERLLLVHKTAREHLHSAQERQKKDYDLRVKESSFEEGDLVYLTNSATQIGESKKLNPVWLGPYLVVKKFSPVLYRIQGKKRTQVVHHDRLKICRDCEIPIWIRRFRHDFLKLDTPLESSSLPSEDEESD